MKTSDFINLLLFILLVFSCNQKIEKNTNSIKIQTLKINSDFGKIKVKPVLIDYKGTAKSIHIFVALCDIQHQAVVVSSEKICNGQDLKHNLYWGAGYGLKRFFLNYSHNWQLIKTYNINDTILERLIFKHKTKNYYIIADAYNGAFIKQTIYDFLKSLAGLKKDTLHINDSVIGIYGNSVLLIYAGHNGLMDFVMDTVFINKDKKQRDAIILACVSKELFYNHVKQANAYPIIWTNDLMPPEAYTILSAINSYVAGDSYEQIRLKAAQSFAKYQKISLKIALKILVSGF